MFEIEVQQRLDRGLFVSIDEKQKQRLGRCIHIVQFMSFERLNLGPAEVETRFIIRALF